jgi:cellulose synthase/poly-beta-1,6-N-acetylglucosamine synthase-like glycosyltransferase
LNRLVVSILAAAQGTLALLAVRDLMLSVAGWPAPQGAHPPAARQRRFAVIVPARDEERSILRTLVSLREIRYPKELFDVAVVADNCRDGTTTTAMGHADAVYERLEGHPGKAAAIGWLLARLDCGRHEAAVVIDADSVASPNLLEVINGCMDQGWRVVQVFDGALNPDESSMAALAAAGMVLNNRIRPQGRERLGLSPGLMGNGMAMTMDVMQQVKWSELGIVEDSEAHLSLLDAGVRIHFEAGASVLSDMPVELNGSRVQNGRWDQGRLRIARHELASLPAGWRLLGIRKADAMVDLVAPRSVLLSANLVLLGVAAALGRRRLALLGTATALTQVLSVLPALFLAEKRTALIALAAAPLFVASKTIDFLRPRRRPVPGRER